MVGNVIQSLYLTQRDYPEAAALSFLMMALILADRRHLHPLRRDRRLHGRRGRGGGLDEPAVARWAWLRRNALPIYAGLAVAYMLIPIVVIAVFSFGETPKDKLTFGLEHGFTTEYWSTRLLAAGAERSAAAPACGWRRSRP